jgi:hypothetical protein
VFNIYYYLILVVIDIYHHLRGPGGGGGGVAELLMLTPAQRFIILAFVTKTGRSVEVYRPSPNSTPTFKLDIREPGSGKRKPLKVVLSELHYSLLVADGTLKRVASKSSSSAPAPKRAKKDQNPTSRKRSA